MLICDLFLALNMESERRKNLRKHIGSITKPDRYNKITEINENIPENNYNEAKKKNCTRSLFSSTNHVTVLGSLSYHNQNKDMPLIVQEKGNKIIRNDDVFSEDKQLQVS